MNNDTDIHASSRDELRAVQQEFQKAVKNNTIEDMRQHIDDEFSFVSFTDKSFDSFDEFVEQWNISRAQMVGNGSFITELNPDLSIFEGNIAICKGNASNQLVDHKGESYKYNSNWTVIFKQTDNSWRVLRAHNSLDPFANPMLIAGVKTKLFKIGIAAFALGVVGASILVKLF